MDEYINSFKGFYDYVEIYMKKNAKRPETDKAHLFAIEFAEGYYEEYQNELKVKGKNVFLHKASQIILDFQAAVKEHDALKLKSILQEVGNLIRLEEGWKEKGMEIFRYDIHQMKLQDEKVENCQAIVDSDIKLYGEVKEITREILEVMKMELVNGTVRMITDIPAWQQPAQISLDMDEFVKQHKEKLDAIKKDTGRETLVVNAYAGPGAGKTTACLATVVELKKKGYTVEYVPEYAKELVYDNPDLLDGSKENQFHILGEQIKRLDRFMGKVDIIVTDASILFNSVYLAEKDPAYEQAISKLYQSYENFNFFVHRGEDFVQEGRMENREESIEKDRQIRELLEKNGLFYGNFNYKTVDKLAEKIEITYKRITAERQEKETNEAKSYEKSYQATAYFKQTTNKPTVIYGNSPENLIAQLQKWNKGRTEGMQFYSCYIRKHNPETNRYENPARYEVSSGKDITPIYLNLPHMDREEFNKVKDRLIKNGAKYNPTKRALYVTKGQVDLNQFSAYLPIVGTHAAEGENRSKHEPDYTFTVDKDTNSVKITVEGKKPFFVKGENYNVDFSTLQEDSVKELIEKFVLPGKELEGEGKEHSITEQKDTHKASKSPQIEGKQGGSKKDSVRGKLAANKGKIEAIDNSSPDLEKKIKENCR